jgi:hypothetical protein
LGPASRESQFQDLDKPENNGNNDKNDNTL